MTETTLGTMSSFTGTTITANRVEAKAVWHWLNQGYEDLFQTAKWSLLIGFIFAACGAAITATALAQDMFFLILPFGAGFLLLGPLLAGACYEISRRRAIGAPLTAKSIFGAFGRNPTQIAAMGFILLIFFLAWIRLATLLYALFFGTAAIALDSFVLTTFFSSDSIIFFIVSNGIGALMAMAVFAISAISIPMLLDKPDCNVMQAIMTSIRAVTLNPVTMISWAGLIVLFTAAGILTGFIGLIITMPMIGHATWHAYKDLTA